MKANNELVLAQKDLQEAGISATLNTNDLVEVVATEIFDKYVEGVYDVQKNAEKLWEKYYALYDHLNEQMRNDLIKTKHISTKDNISSSFDVRCNYRDKDYITIQRLAIKEELSKGMIVDRKDNSKSFSCPTTKKFVLIITLSASNDTNKENIKVGKIEGYISTSTEKQFTMEVEVSSDTIKQFAKEVKEHNKRVDDIIAWLPKNGVLSVERFTREARVKMNKKILSSQSPDFKKKMMELFNIKL